MGPLTFSAAFHNIYYMLAIRLARMGKKKYPTYRITIAEKSKDTFGGFLEVLGHYNPHTKLCEVNKERILYWISRGAKPSATAHNLFVSQHVLEGPKVRAWRPKKKSDKVSKADPARTSAGVKQEEKKEAEKSTAQKSA